jgi:S1-C subfamily serine protease
MENLTKQQLVLTGILVSFVTSIATGIVTVSLLEQAPKGVTQTINRVVERTIERVVTEPAQSNAASPIITRETVVVSADDRVAEAIEKNAGSVVKIYGTPSIGAPAEFVGLGIIAAKEGFIATDASLLLIPRTAYFVELSSGKRIDATEIKGLAGRVGFLKTTSQDTFTAALFTDSDAIKLGQAVVAIGGRDDLSVAEGIVARLVRIKDESAAPLAAAGEAKILYSIETTISPKDTVTGGPIVNLSGDIVALSATLAGEPVNVPANTVLKVLKAAQGAVGTN